MAPRTHSGTKSQWWKSNFFLWLSVSRRDKRVRVRDVFVGVGVGVEQAGWLDPGLAQWRGGRVRDYIVGVWDYIIAVLSVLRPSYLALYRRFAAAAQLFVKLRSLALSLSFFPTRRKRD